MRKQGCKETQRKRHQGLFLFASDEISLIKLRIKRQGTKFIDNLKMRRAKTKQVYPRCIKEGLHEYIISANSKSDMCLSDGIKNLLFLLALINTS